MNNSSFEKYKVMIVDDSSLIRGYMSRALQVDPQIEICGVVENGQIAVDIVNECKPEVILLDIEMPVMDGITALPLLIKKRPEVKIIMISTLTTHNAAMSIEAMSKGATDYMEKPSADMDKALFKGELIQKIKAIADSSRIHAQKYESDKEFKFLRLEHKLKVPEKIANVTRSEEEASKTESQPRDIKNESLKISPMNTASDVEAKVVADAPAFINDESRFKGFKPDVLAIGSSTGGPNVLQEVFGVIGNSINIPIFITQHMPPKFTTFLAKSIEKVSGVKCVEPENGQKVENGCIYLAPGDYHMLVESKGLDKYIKLTQDEPENYCRPSVDPMLRSLIAAYGRNVLVAIMTGMGRDGADGAKIVHEKGGKVIIQDEESSVVWGMPGAVAKEGFQDGIYSSDDIAKQIVKLCVRSV